MVMGMSSGAKLLAISLCALFLLSPFSALSVGAEDSSRMPSGQTTDRLVLGELFTGTWCGYCKYAEQAMEGSEGIGDLLGKFPFAT